MGGESWRNSAQVRKKGVKLNGSVGCSEAARSVVVGVWMGVRGVRSGRMVMT